MEMKLIYFQYQNHLEDNDEMWNSYAERYVTPRLYVVVVTGDGPGIRSTILFPKGNPLLWSPICWGKSTEGKRTSCPNLRTTVEIRTAGKEIQSFSGTKTELKDLCK